MAGRDRETDGVVGAAADQSPQEPRISLRKSAIYTLLNDSLFRSHVIAGCYVRFPHGLLVIAAPESVDTHDDWDTSVDAVHAGVDSLYVGVRPTASGPVSVLCVRRETPLISGYKLFDGLLEFPGGSMAISEPNDVVAMCIPVEFGRTRVEVFGDDDGDESAEIVIRVAAIE